VSRIRTVLERSVSSRGAQGAGRLLKSAFERFDIDGSGKLSKSEFNKALLNLKVIFLEFDFEMALVVYLSPRSAESLFSYRSN
jgi:Ca2+-binding EF-hand superfamily protein